MLDNVYLDKDSCMETMIEKMKDKFDKYWGECNLLISIAIVLDRRNEMQLIEYYFP